MRLPFSDVADFEDARRGQIATLTEPLIRATDGRVVWDADAYGFLDSECPETVNPSLASGAARVDARPVRGH